MNLIPELESRLARELETLKPLLAIDSALRSQPVMPEWLTHVRLESGVYEPMEPVLDWDRFWESVQSLDAETLSRCFRAECLIPCSGWMLRW